LLTYEANSDLNDVLGKHKDSSVLLSYAINKLTTRHKYPLIRTEQLLNILKHTQLPTPQEQLENLISWVGDLQERPGMAAPLELDIISRIGATDYRGLEFIVRHAIDGDHLLNGSVAGNDQHIAGASRLHLTFKGWAFYEELKRGHSSSRVAFMAMKFNEADLDAIVENHFKPAVAATGFDLRRINDGQPAGLIDDKLRVAIRQSRFIVADLTHHNNGAYWEAGYAEGLGKPVIYTCRADVFADKKSGTHFDTNHHLTVVWEPSMLEEAAQRLKDTIRATLPEDAQQEG